MLKKVYISLIRYLVFKPLMQLEYIVNGVAYGEPKWYQRKLTLPVRCKILADLNYKLMKYIMFYKIK